jgi:hypothetical protein
MNSPFSVSKNGKPASRASRWRLAAAVGTMTVIGATAAIALPASAAVAAPAVNPGPICTQYHSWYVCIWTSGGYTYASAKNTSPSNAGTHTVFIEANGDSAKISSSPADYTSGYTGEIGVPITADPSAKSWGGVDNTRIVGADI